MKKKHIVTERTAKILLHIGCIKEAVIRGEITVNTLIRELKSALEILEKSE